MKKLPPKLLTELDDLAGELEVAVDEASTYHGDRSERWQEGDAGMEYQSWIEEIQAAIDAMQSVRATPKD